MSSGQRGKPPFRVAVCVAVEDGGHGRWQTLPTAYATHVQATNAGNALWVLDVIPDLRGVRVVGSDGAQVGTDLFRS
jgi:hypothetical protein